MSEPFHEGLTEIGRDVLLLDHAPPVYGWINGRAVVPQSIVDRANFLMRCREIRHIDTPKPKGKRAKRRARGRATQR